MEVRDSFPPNPCDGGLWALGTVEQEGGGEKYRGGGDGTDVERFNMKRLGK